VIVNVLVDASVNLGNELGDMEKINFVELRNWCGAGGYALQNWIPSLPSADRLLELALPSETQAIPELLDSLVHIKEDETERLVWVRDWTIWNDRSQDIGLRHLDLLTDGFPAEVPENEKSRIYVLQHSEWRETIALLTVPVLYGWDSHLFFASGEALVNISHDGRISVSIQSETRANAARLEAWL
jgi:hypothetical protein